MEGKPDKLPREKGNQNDGLTYERKLMLFIGASLSQNREVDNFWMVSNPTGITKIDDVVVRISFNDSGKKDIAVFIQSKHTDKLLWLNVDKKRPKQTNIEIKLAEYEKAYNDFIKMSSNKPETQELRKLLKGVDKKDYYVCIFTNAKKLYPELQCKQFVRSHSLYFLDTRKCGQYRQFDHKNVKFNSNFYKQLHVFIGQANFEDIDFSTAEFLGEDYKHRLENLDKAVKYFMQKKELCWVLTKPAFERNWFKVLAMEWMYINLNKVEEINPKFERLWLKILADQNVINLREDKIWPMLAYYYQCVIIKEVDENFDWQKGMTQSTKTSINQKYGENVTDLRELLFLLWSEAKLPLAIKSDSTRNILRFLAQFKTVRGGFVVFSSDDHPEVISDIKQISESVELLEEAMTVKISLQGRPPVALSDIGEWQTFSELKIAQLLAWTNSLEDGRHYTVGPVLRKPDDNSLTRTFTRKQDKTHDKPQNDYSQYVGEISHSTHLKNATTSSVKQGEDIDHLATHRRKILTVEGVLKLAKPGLHIITGDPGMGKSTVLQELAYKSSPKNFVIYVILRDCLEDIAFDGTWPSIETDPIQYFFNKMARKSDDNISRSIFLNHKTSKRLCLYLDGFDEILPDHGIKLSSLIASILDNTSIPIFCTTRPHGEDQIAKGPKTIFLQLSPFGSEQIRQYLMKIKIEAKNIENHFDDNFLGNPLHLNMISQIYKASENHTGLSRGKMYKMFIERKHITYNEKMKQALTHWQTETSIKNHRLLALVDIFGRECVTSKGLISDTEIDDILNYIGEHNIGIVDVSKTKGKFRFLHRTFAEYLVAEWLIQTAKQDIANKTYFKYMYKQFMCQIYHEDMCWILNELSSCFAIWSEASKRLHFNCGIFKLDEFGRNVAQAASYEEQEKWINSVCKCRLFYRKDAVLQWTFWEFRYMLPNQNGSAVIDDINRDYPTCKPLVESKWRRLVCRKNTSLSDWCTKLLAAIDSENKDDINVILKSKMSLLKTGVGVIAFHSAITTGNRSIVELLLDLRPMLLNEHDDNRNTALHIACALGCRDIVLLLLKKHADIDIVNKHTWSPLEMAAAEGHLEVVSLLLDHIRERKGVDGHDSSTEPYHNLLYREAVPIACANERWDVATWLIEHGADATVSNNDGFGAIHFAAQVGQLEILTLLLGQGLNINAKINTGATPLSIATLNNHLDTSKWLLEHGADPSLPDDDGWAAMHYAAQQGRIEILTLLLDRGLNVNATIKTGLMPLHIAICNNHLDTTEWLLEHGADPSLPGDDGWTAMHYAALHGRIETLTLLLGRGLNVNAKTNSGLIPLHIAICENPLDITEWLLQHGADPTLSNDDGWAAMHFAALTGHVELLTLLFEMGLNVNTKTNNGLTPVYIAISCQNVVTTAWLLEHDADPTLLYEHGYSAMHFAAKEGQLKILTLLLETVANVNAETDIGETPLTIAIDNEHWDSVKWFLDHGADPTLTNKHGWAAMHFAAKNGQLEILSLLLEMEVNINAETDVGETPLSIAIDNDHRESVKWLLDHGADPTLSDDDGWAAMHFASGKGQVDMLALLLKRGFNMDAKTNKGETLLAIAIASKHVVTVEWLLDNGADPTPSDKDGWTAVHFAAATDQLDILKLLSARGLNVNSKTHSGQTPLTISFNNKHWGIGEWLLDHGADPTISDEDGWSAIHYAVGKLKILRLLFKRRLKVNWTSNSGQTPLTISIKNDHWYTVKWMLMHDADPTLSEGNGWLSIHFAAQGGELEILMILLESGLNVNAETSTGETPLTIASRYEHCYIVDWLLEHGADPTLSEEDGWTALHYAASQTQLKILTLLLDRGVNVNSKTHTGQTPLTISLNNKHWGIGKWLLDHGADPTISDEDGWSAIHYAAEKLKILKLLFKRGLNVNAKSNTGQTPLTISIKNDLWDTVKWLLMHDADPTLSDGDGWLSIHFAAKGGQLEILMILLDRGLNVNAETNIGETPLTIASKYEHCDIVDWLLQHGADPTLSEENGWTALHYAASQKQLKLVTLLLDRGLNVNARTSGGSTPLNIAILNKRLHTAEWLLQHGADPTLSTNTRWAAIHFAAREGQLEILTLLLESGVDVNAKTNTDQTALTIAKKYKQWGVVDWLLEHGTHETAMLESEA